MKKSEAMKLLGDTPTAVAEAVGVTPQAVGQWPDELPRRIEDRVLAALWRKQRAGIGGGRAAQKAQAAHVASPADSA